MLARVQTAALVGIDAFTVTLEADFSRQGMPAFTLVGLAEGAVREAKERVFSALKNRGYKLPPARITVNLAPADMKKGGAGYDLPLAMGLLAASGALEPDVLSGWFMAGELSLDGALKRINGALPLAIRARAEGARGLLLPPENAREAAVVEGLPVYPVATLTDAVALVTGESDIRPVDGRIDELFEHRERFPLDFAEVKGQEHAKRAIEIAAAGSHNLLLMGPPGSGKTMLAKRIPTVLTPLAFEEALEVTKIYSVAGALDGASLLVTRPFRSPHHTISDVGLIGGGVHPRPGEVSLAHRGVLFLDELPEFKKQALEVLRQPLEDGSVVISRSMMSIRFPSDFMLVAAMNPCRCGYLTDDTHTCTCSPLDVQRYRGRISGPLLDRIDLQVEVPAVDYKDLRTKTPALGSDEMRGRVTAARTRQTERFATTPGGCILTNSQLSGRLLDTHCPLGTAEHDFLENAVRKLGLSARAFTRVLRIARTIADLAETDTITTNHLAEAITYRTMDREGV